MGSRKQRVKIGAAILAVGISALVAVQAAATITSTTNDAAGATIIAGSIAQVPATVTGATYDSVTGGTPNGIFVPPPASLSFFPTDGTTFGILTSGNVQLADDPNSSSSSGQSNGGGTVRGVSDLDVTIMKINLAVPTGANCLTVDFAFYSDEFPEFVGGGVSDSFVAELDTSDWTTTGGGNPPTAPNNFAFDQNNNPISINSTGNIGATSANAVGTTYDGATPLLQASTPVSAGAHVLYLSIFDQGDTIYDSAAFLDNLRFRTVANVETDCKAGAITVPPDDGECPPGNNDPVRCPAPGPITSLKVKPAGTVPVPVACPASSKASCSGTVTLNAFVGTAAASAKARRKKGVRLGSASYKRIRAGKTRVVNVRLSRRKLRIVRRHGKVRVGALARERQGSRRARTRVVAVFSLRATR